MRRQHNPAESRRISLRKAVPFREGMELV